MIPYAPALASKSPRQPKSWADMPAGLHLKAEVETVVDALSRHWFGDHLLKLGALGAELTMTTCSVRRHVALTESAHPDSNMVACFEELPIQRRSFDAVLMPFSLDFAHDPHGLIRQVSRCIAVDGHLAVVGLNPLSCAGMARFAPWQGESLLSDMRGFSTFRVKDWMQLMGYEVCAHKTLLHRSLLRHRPLQPHTPTQRWLAKWCPALASVYVLVGKKRRIPMTPINQPIKAKPKPAFAPSGARAC